MAHSLWRLEWLGLISRKLPENNLKADSRRSKETGDAVDINSPLQQHFDVRRQALG